MAPTTLSRRSRPRGFAIIISLSLAVLLTVVAVGLLGLSSISLRASTRGEADAIARANARVALELAISQLQELTGPDTRITARANLLDPGSSNLLGAWKSWEGSLHDHQGRPIPPGDYAKEKEKRFLGWLSSDLSTSPVPPDTTARDKAVTLVGRISAGDSADRQIHLIPRPIVTRDIPGALAWWTGGENQKARLRESILPADPGNMGEWASIAKSHGNPDPGAFGLESLLDDSSDLPKTVSLLQNDLLSQDPTLRISREHFHDLSHFSVGLLTNTSTGGWRKDLSIATEKWESLPQQNLPFFRLSADRDLEYSRPSSGSPYSDRSVFYPWSSYRGTSEMPIYRHAAVSTWENLRNYAVSYRNVTSSSSGRSRISSSSYAIDTSDAYGFIHKVRILPIVARIQWVFSHSAGPPTNPPANPPAGVSLLEPRLLVTPVITMWNPYNVEINIPDLSFNILKPLPVALRYQYNGSSHPNYYSLFAGSNNYPNSLSSAGSLNYTISGQTGQSNILRPGETRVFSPGPNSQVAAGSTLPLQQGYRGNGGHYFSLRDPATGTPAVLPSTSTISADARFDTSYNDVTVGVGIYMDMNIGGARHLAYRMVYNPAAANEFYPPLSNLASATLAQSQSTPQPFLSTIFGARMASKTSLPAKGFVQSSPLVNYTAMGTKDVAETTIARHYRGTSHPVNSPFDYSFIRHAPGGDSYLPNASDTTGQGYIVTGFNKSDGLSRCVIAEIPTRPLLSLGELQHWDLRYENPIPPYALNLIGNSDATPLLPPNAVVNSADAGLSVNLQHDDSYCANHLLFDDWFFSSIAPDPTQFGTGGRSARQVWVDWLSGKRPLPNASYQPIHQDRASADPSRLFDEWADGRDSYRTIASRLEVAGMFNVNSTSVTAWKALLGHARRQSTAYIDAGGSGWSVKLSDPLDHPAQRFSIAGDSLVGSSGTGGEFDGATEFSGFRTLSDDQLELLAGFIVDEVRKRGPFLSLAEFVNRQLSEGNFALAGTLQAALNELAKDPSNSPYQIIQSIMDASGTATGTPPRAADAEYSFPDAAVGSSAYGLPGWTRQADLLRPLAPILTVRDDSFTIRAYGDARDANDRVIARAVCEATVRRTRDFVDPREAADITTSPTLPSNQRLGRRYEVLSFRWLHPSEI